MADDRLPCGRPESMVATRSDNVMARLTAISFSPFQKASSRLTLVLCPAMTIERLMTGDFIAHLLFQPGAGRGLFELCRWQTALGFARPGSDHEQADWQRRIARIRGVFAAYEHFAG